MVNEPGFGSAKHLRAPSKWAAFVVSSDRNAKDVGVFRLAKACCRAARSGRLSRVGAADAVAVLDERLAAENADVVEIGSPGSPRLVPPRLSTPPYPTLTARARRWLERGRQANHEAEFMENAMTQLPRVRRTVRNHAARWIPPRFHEGLKRTEAGELAGQCVRRRFAAAADWRRLAHKGQATRACGATARVRSRSRGAGRPRGSRRRATSRSAGGADPPDGPEPEPDRRPTQSRVASHPRLRAVV